MPPAPGDAAPTPDAGVGTGLLQSRAVPGETLLVVGGAWLLILGLAALAYRFNRRRGDE